MSGLFGRMQNRLEEESQGIAQTLTANELESAD